MNCGRYVHLGADVSVFSGDILGVFDLENVSVVRSVNDYLGAEQRAGRVYYCSLDMPRTFVVCTDRVYVTNVGGKTIVNRFSN